MLAIKLNTNEASIEQIRSGSTSLLQFCYDEIGCSCIETVHPRRLPNPYVMIIDESGLLKELPVNPLASVLYETDRHGWPIFGTALLMKEAITIDGPDIVSLDEDDIEAIKAIIGSAVCLWDGSSKHVV